MQPYAMSSAYASMPNFPPMPNTTGMPYANNSGCATPEMNNSPIGCFGMKPRKNDCFTKMEYHKPHHGGYHHMGRKHEGHMRHHNNCSMFGSQQSQFSIQGKYADSTSTYGTGMIPSVSYSGNGATGVPAFVTDMMKDFKQAFGDMGGVFGGEQGYAQTPINYAGSISTPYAPLDATTLPAYQESAPSPYMGGYDLSSTTPPPAPPVPSSALYGAPSAPAAPSYLGSTNTSFIDQYLAGAGGQFGAGNLGGLTSQYPQFGSAPMDYAPVAPQQYAV
jgi:hypothetical protein